RFEPRAGAAMVEVIPPSGDPVTQAVAAGGAPFAYAETGAPGTYRVVERDGSGIETGAAVFVVNAGDLRESDLRLNAELAAQVSGAAGDGARASGRPGQVSQLWPLLALLAGGLLLLEWLVALWPRRRAAGAGGRG
ncbi:MAG: hypothetical protein ACR2J8_11435, partial [Thermomicrobiales bacterium]